MILDTFPRLLFGPLGKVRAQIWKAIFAVILTEHNLETPIPAYMKSNGYLR
jgi:hypothetical protein